MREDLPAIAAAARQVSGELHRATEELNQALGEVEQALGRLGLGVRADVEMGVCGYLQFARHKGSWKLLHSRTRGPRDSVPLLNCSREMRVTATRCLGALVEALEKNAAEELAKVDEAVSQTEDFVRRVQELTRA